MRYDAIILSHPKDYTKIYYCLESMRWLNPLPDNIYLVTPDRATSDNFVCLTDSEVIDLDISEVKFSRPNWIYQQLIKTFQDVTRNDLYMCIDSDLIFNRPIDVFAGGKPNFFISDRDQHHIPYFSLMEIYFGFGRQVNHTYINDFMLFDKNVCREMLPDLKTFVNDLNEILVNEEYLFSEFETYGNYVTKTHPRMYNHTHTKTKTHGQYKQWSHDEIRSAINMYKGNTNVDLFTIHTWT